jgi:hypothetical protein
VQCGWVRQRLSACRAPYTSDHIRFEIYAGRHDRGACLGRFCVVLAALCERANRLAQGIVEMPVQLPKGVLVGSRDAGAIPAASTFSVQASTGDWRCHETAKLPDDEDVASPVDTHDLRQVTTVNVGPRPVRATESATRLMAEYPDLAVVSAAWRELPEAVRVAIVAMVNDSTV